MEGNLVCFTLEIPKIDTNSCRYCAHTRNRSLIAEAGEGPTRDFTLCQMEVERSSDLLANGKCSSIRNCVKNMCAMAECHLFTSGLVNMGPPGWAFECSGYC